MIQINGWRQYRQDDGLLRGWYLILEKKKKTT